MKRYLGIIYLLFASTITYIVIFDKLKNYLSPQLQIYIKLSIIPLFIVGLVLIINKKVHYDFKFSDLILLLPIIIFFISGDGKLSLQLADNRATNLANPQIRYEAVTNTEEEPETKEEQSSLPSINPTYDFSNPYFEVIDANYEGLANYLTVGEKASKYVGQTIRVKGFTTKYASYLPDGMFAIGKYIITCCVADASFQGFYVKYDLDQIHHNKWYEIEGVLEQGIDKDGYQIMYIKAINVKEIDSSKEEQYVFPCYAYDNGSCAEVSKYDLSY